MRTIRENLLVQFTVVSFVIMLVLALGLALLLNFRLNDSVDLLKVHGAAMMSGTMIQSSDPYSIPSIGDDVKTTRWLAVGGVGFAFLILYGSLVTIVWRGWRIINRQRDALMDAQERTVRTERLAAIGELAAGVAHELRNPLGGIKNAVYYIKSRLSGSQFLAENARLGEFLEIIDSEIDSSNGMVIDLMEYTRVNPAELTATKLETLIDDALIQVGLNGNVAVIKELDNNLPDVMVNEELLRRAFANLIKNADEAMPDGGTLTISAKVVNTFVEVQFRDTGTGISDADITKIMDPLFTTKTKGIGMGLSIVNRIVERHNGELEVTSKVGEGTTFALRLHRTMD